ncbi:MAG: phage tail protein [Dehalococcoidales bacterium]|nr:MAG: phage tail protein [Dehalococcoidales bacterium]
MASIVDTVREDPLLGVHFGLEVSGKISGYFTEVSGLGSETETIEQKVVNEKGHEVVLKIPGRLKWGDIVLKRGITSNLDMWEWRKQVEEGDVANARMNGSIVMYDQTLTEVARWNFNQAWPTKISGPTPKADSNEIGVEELTLAHEFIERVN